MLVHGSTVEKYSYLNGYNCTEVIHYKITNGGHTWPGSAFPSAGTNYDIDASIEIWNFLSKYDINGLMTCGNVGVSEETLNPALSVYPNPAEDKLQIEGLDNLNGLGKLTITDFLGALLITVESADNGIDISELSSGIYLVHIEHATGERSIKFTKK